MYQGGDVYSQIFDVTDLSRLDVETRVLITSGGATPTVTTLIQTTSDATFDNSAWSTALTFNNTSPWTGTFTGYTTTLGRFVRAKLTVAANYCATVCVNAVGREP